MEFMVSIGTIVLVYVLAWITPGPNMIAVMNASLEHGRRHGVMTGLGLAWGGFLWSVFAVLGVSILFDLFPRAVLTLKLGGAAYLIWLGINSVKSALTEDVHSELEQTKTRLSSQSFRTGFIVSMTNPKAALFYGFVMTAFIPVSLSGWFLAGVVCLLGLLAALLHSVTATVFSTKVAVRFFKRAHRWITGVFGVVFIGLGGSVAYAALRRS